MQTNLHDQILDLATTAEDIFLGTNRKVLVSQNGQLTESGSRPLPPEELKELLDTVLSPNQKDRLAIEQSVDFTLESQNFRMRGNATQTFAGLEITLRVLPGEPVARAAQQAPKALREAIKQRSGLILLAGPTGSGKSTTLAALISERMKSQAMRIVTIEDPIEYLLSDDGCAVVQRELHTHVGSFAKGLRDALRQRPDLIFVGELRDAETIQMAMTAAETGHLVVSTIHASTPETAVQRIVDAVPGHMGGQVRGQLAATLSLIATQRLERLGNSVTPKFELLVNTDACAQLIREEKYHQLRNLMASSAHAGMIVATRS